MKCRHCQSQLSLPLIDLGSAPPSNAYLRKEDLNKPEIWYPLRVLVCTNCWLVQTEDMAEAEELFDSNYAYFSSFSTTWLEHAKKFVEQAIIRFGLNQSSTIVEVAANDGYLLQYVREHGIPCYGIEPTARTAQAARNKGVEIVQQFFGLALAKELTEQGRQADFMVANNVLAHVPNINDFIAGFYKLLKPGGIATFEFPHLLNLLKYNQFDTIYHEHYSYLSLTAVSRILAANGLSVFDVEEIPTHGGSLRVFAQRQDSGKYPVLPSVDKLLYQETEQGLLTTECYAYFQSKADRIKDNLLSFLLQAKQEGKKVAAYGAAAKGNTLLNYAGIRSDLIEYVVDRSPEKQGKFMPGSRIPIVTEDRLKEHKPDYVLVLPWNLIQEITNQLQYIKTWSGIFVAVVPCLKILVA